MNNLLIILVGSLAVLALCAFGAFKLWKRGAWGKTSTIALIIPSAVAVDLAYVAAKNLF